MAPPFLGFLCIFVAVFSASVSGQTIWGNSYQGQMDHLRQVFSNNEYADAVKQVGAALYQADSAFNRNLWSTLSTSLHDETIYDVTPKAEDLTSKSQHVTTGTDHPSTGVPKVTTATEPMTTMTEFVTTATPGYHLSPACKNASMALSAAVVQGHLWALNMLDATTKIESGILQGNVLWPGVFSQCMAVESNDTQPLFRGMHASMVISLKNKPGPIFPGSSVPGIATGICFPDVCTELDTFIIVGTALALVSKGQLVPVYSALHTHEKTPLDAPAIGVIIMLTIIVCVLVFATGYEFYLLKYRSLVNAKASSDDQAELPVGQYASVNAPVRSEATAAAEGHRGWFPMLMLRLSLYSNAVKLLSTERNPSSLDAVHGLRFFSMAWVILGHTYFFAIQTISNPLKLAEALKGFEFQAIANALVSVDTFFLLSGTLVSYLLLKELQRKEGPRHINWAIYYFHRFWRLTPPYMLILGTHTALFKYWGNGPFWPADGVEPDCPKQWWANLLYMNTILDNKMGCMGWTWYLANDMWFYLLSPIFVVALYWNKVVGIISCAAVIYGSGLATAIVTGVNHCAPETIVAFAAPSLQCQQQGDLYFKPWYRIGPYMIGLLLGYLLYKTARKVNMKWYITAMGWVLSSAFGLAIVYGLYGIPNGHLLSPAANALYGGFHRTAWACAVAWVIFACVTGYGGPVNTLLSWQPLMPLSRLTYVAYLIHPVVMMCFYYSRETALYFTHSQMVWLYLGNMCVSYALAFVGSLAFESPMIGLEKVVFHKLAA